MPVFARCEADGCLAGAAEFHYKAGRDGGELSADCRGETNSTHCSFSTQHQHVAQGK